MIYSDKLALNYLMEAPSPQTESPPVF